MPTSKKPEDFAPRPPGIPIPTGTKELQLTLTICGDSPCIVVQVDWIALFTDIIEGLIDLFSGRPKDEATQQSAQSAMRAKNPTFRLYGLQLIRMLNQWDIVTSTSEGSGRRLLDAAFGQAVENGIAMGFGRLEIQDGLLWILSRDGQAGNNPPPIIHKVSTQPMVIWGPPSVQESRDKCAAKATAKGLVLGDWDRFVERCTWQESRLGQLFRVQFVKQGDIPPLKCSKGYEWNYAFELCTPRAQHGKCPTGYVYNKQSESCDPIIPPGPQGCPPGTTWSDFWKACLPNPVDKKCPDGYLYNPQTDSCDPVVPPPPPPCPAGQQWNVDFQLCAPTPQNQNCPAGFAYNDATQQCDPVGPQPGPQDECCQAAVAQLNAIGQSLASIAQELNGIGGSQGMASVVAALGDITFALTNILDTLTTIANAPQPPPLDLTPIIEALTTFGACICQIPELQAQQITTLDDKLQAIADAIGGVQGVDVQGIVDQLKAIFTTLDPKPEIYSNLVQAGWISGDLAQLAASGDLGTGLVGILATMFFRGLAAYIKYWTTIDITGALGTIGPSTASETLLTNALTRGLTSEEKLVKPILGPLLDSIKNLLIPTDKPKLGNVFVDPDKPIAAATGIAISAGVVAYLAAFAGIDEGEPLAHIAELIAAAIGFEELRDVQIGPLVRYGIERIAEMKAKAVYRQELPGVGAVAALAARGLVDKPTYEEIAGFDGLPVELTEPTRLGGYQGMNPRILMRLVDTGLFDDADIADELTFSGMRPTSQHRFLLAARYMATDPQRKALITQIEAAYQGGILSDDELLANVDSAEHNTDKANLILAAAKWKLQIAETKLLETEYAALFRGGLIDDATYRSLLEGISLQPAVIDIRAGLVEAQANVSLHKKQIAEAARTESETQRAARRTAMKAYEDGLTSEATLATALLATGLTAAQVAAWTALAALERSGSAKWLFGLQLQPAAAQLLKERLTALTDQRKRLLISDTAYTDALKALGLPAKVINALRAAADALVSPKTAATRVVVETT